MWENQIEQQKFYNVTFSRSYLDEEKRFHDTNSFGRDELRLVAKLADEVHALHFQATRNEENYREQIFKSVH